MLTGRIVLPGTGQRAGWKERGIDAILLSSPPNAKVRNS